MPALSADLDETIGLNINVLQDRSPENSDHIKSYMDH